MKLKLLLLSLFTLLLSTGSWAQTTTIIGAGSNAGATSSNGSPIYRSSASSSFDYSQSVLLYTFADLSAAGIYNGAVISSIGFNKTNAFGISPGETGSMTIGMNNSGSNSLDTSDTYPILTTGFTNVYTNAAVDETIISDTPGYVVFTLDTPFTYTGGSIEIGLDWDISVTTGNPTTGGFAFAYDPVTGVQGRGNSSGSPITAALTAANTRLYQAEMIYTGGTAPTCLPSANLTAVSNTFDTADLSWTSGGSGETAWDIELGPEGFTPTGTPTNAGVTNPYTAMSLTANTGYDFYVRADCTGGDFSSWAGPFNFRTLCTAVTDFNENFDGVSTPDLPSCWTSFNTTPVGTSAALVQTNTSADSSAPNGVRMYSGSLTGNIGSGTTDEGENILISPSLSNLAAGTHRIRFSADAGTSTSTIEVGTMADATDPSTFTALGTFAPTTTHATYIQNFDMYSGTDQFVAFRHVFAGTFDTMYLDDIVWEPIPACANPTVLTASTLSDTSVAISWVDNAGATASSILYGATGFDPLTAGTTVAAGADSGVVTGLMPETAYDFYVTQDCSSTGNGMSGQIGPASATTLCAAIVPDALETFDTFVPNCWEEATDGDLTTGPTGLGSGDWGAEEFAHASTTGGGAVNVNLYNLGTSDWVLSPLYDLSAGGYELNLDVAVTNYNSSAADVMGSDDQVILAYTLDGTTWTALQTWTAANQPATAGETFNADLSAITGTTVQFALYASEGTVDDLEDYDFHMDNFQIRTIPSCLDSNNLQFISSTQTTADITWDSNNAGTAGNFEYLLDTANSYPTGPDASVAATGTLTGASGTTLPIAQAGQLTGLMPSTDYDVYVREICTGTDTSPWSMALAFTTACAPITDFNEDFDSVSTPDLPSCWSFFATDLATGTDPYVRTSTAADNTAPNGVQLYSGSADGSSIPADLLLISPELSNLSAGTHRLKFFADITVTTSTVEVGTMTDPNDPTTFTTLGTFSPTTTHTEYIQNFDTYAGTDTYIALKHVFASTFDNLYLDNIVWEMIPACQAPLDITLLSATDTMATIGWTNNNSSTVSSIIYGPAGFDPTMTGTTIVGGADTATISGLMGETNYDFYVTQDCSASADGLSVQAGPLSIQTPCAAIAAPYFVDFESFTAATSGFVNDQCWNEVSPTDFDWAIDAAGGTGSTGTGPNAAFSGTTFMFIEASNGSNGDIATVLSPAIDLTALTAPSVSFYVHMFGGFITDLNVGISTDNGATFTNELTISGQQQALQADPWKLAVVDLASYSGQTVIVSFSAAKSTMTGNTYENDISIDDFKVDELPPCNDPTALTATNITATAADLGWTPGDVSQTEFDIELDVSGFTPTGTPTAAAVANPYNATALMAETSYDFYVRGNCAIGQETSWVGPFTFTTPCAVIVPDSFEPFDTFLPNCWEEATDGDLTTGPTGLGSGDWGVEEFAHASTSGGGAVNINLYNLGTSDWLLSPLYDLSAGGYELNVDVAVTAYNSTAAIAMGSDDQVILLYTEDGTTWNTLVTWDASNTPSAAGDTYNNPLTGLTGATTQFAFYATEGLVDDPEDLDFHLDNFQVRTPPTCPDTANLTLVSNTDVEATINFDSGNATSAGNYEYSLTTVAGTAPAVTGAWTDVPGATPNVTYTITGLTAETEYFVHVREVCAVGDESAWTLVPINFTTACAAIAAPYSEDFEMFTTSTAPFSLGNCWSGSGGSYFWESAPGTDTSSTGTGPSPTITTGNYFFTEASSGSAGDTTDLVSPLVDLTALTAPSLAFNYHMFGGQIGTLDVLVNGTTNVWTLSGQQQASDVTPWELATVDLSAYAGQTISITFRATSAGTFEGDIAIDNVNFDELPSCLDVSGISLDSTTSDSVTVSWTENNIPASTAWEVVAVPAGDPAPTAGTSNVTMNPFTIGSLMSNTSYDVYVRTDCSMTFAGPLTVTTDCAAVTMFPAATDFTNNVPNACWSEAGDGEIATGPTGIGASQWKDGRAYTNGVGTVVPSNVMNLYTLGDREWLISESYDLSSLTTKVLTVEVAVTDYSFSGTSTAADTGVMGSDDSVDLLITVDSGLTWTSLDAWNVGNQPAVTGDSYFYDLAAYSGTVQFAFLASDGAVDDTEDYDFHVSRFVVDATAGNEDVSLQNAVTLYPNPVSGDTMTINLGNVPASQVGIAVYNTLGQEVISRTFNNVSNNTIVVDNLSSLTSGVYLVNISNGDSTAVKRFIKQ